MYRYNKHVTCFTAETEEPHLPPMTDPGDQVDPYDLACSGGGYGCIIGKPQRFSKPVYCFNGYCTYNTTTNPGCQTKASLFNLYVLSL